MGAALEELLDVLDLEAIEVDVFRGRSPEIGLQRIFGGQVAGQALVAATRTVPGDRPVHSLHAYFLRPGDPAVPILYLVDRIRDGRSFTTRRVVGIQHGKAIFNLQASFALPEDGVRHADPMPAVPEPESLPRFEKQLAEYPGGPEAWLSRPQPIELRFVGKPAVAVSVERLERPPDQQVWVRTAGALPDDPVLHACIITYVSDLTLLESVLLPHRMSWQTNTVVGASLDHAMWFHRPFRADDWLLYHQHSPSAAGARGLATGQIFTRHGDLAVSVVQEGLVRRPRG